MPYPWTPTRDTASGVATTRTNAGCCSVSGKVREHLPGRPRRKGCGQKYHRPFGSLLIFSERAWLIRGSAGSSLTDAERRIAELAAQGLSNRQVAGRVFLSADTVAFSPAARLLEARRQLAGAARAHGGR